MLSILPQKFTRLHVNINVARITPSTAQCARFEQTAWPHRQENVGRVAALVVAPVESSIECIQLGRVLSFIYVTFSLQMLAEEFDALKEIHGFHLLGIAFQQGRNFFQSLQLIQICQRHETVTMMSSPTSCEGKILPSGVTLPY